MTTHIAMTLLLLAKLSLAFQYNPLTCPDPRLPIVHRTFSNGEKIINKGGFVIIAWSDSKLKTKYQVWGSDTLMSQAELEA